MDPYDDLSSSDDDLTTTTPRRLNPPAAFYRPFFPHQPKSLSGIALRAFCLGATASASLLLTLTILFINSTNPIWRAPFFTLCLSTFHFLEFWVTAERNTLVATVDSFLLTANWPAYAIAHASALAECLFVSVFFPGRNWAPWGVGPVLMTLGLVAVVAGQAVRSMAMLHAGRSFNHQVQMTRGAAHELVTDGVYALVRHPSYFGFFYWGLGTQMVMGNVVCFFAYAVVLWTFFKRRVQVEEGKLVEFFGDRYVDYRRRVPTLMPFI
ncbi:farnesyl cysteine-carboxyl methyltransferase [Lecanicillium sp. MT-2017a]|nr:farnesyl cysteine-carboxyl methyltransferase [Lecanicillium sp. MT-2017a]